MKCPKCGTNINNSTTICPTCGSYISQQDKDVQLASQNVTPQKTKSKMLANHRGNFHTGDRRYHLAAL